MSIWNRKSGRRFARGFFSLLVLSILCALLLPISVPLVNPADSGKDTAVPFPCQSRPCGCRSADQCWKKCCCFTNSQKLAWAKENKVRVPDFVAVAARKESRRSVDVIRSSDKRRVAKSSPVVATALACASAGEAGCDKCKSGDVGSNGSVLSKRQAGFLLADSFARNAMSRSCAVAAIASAGSSSTSRFCDASLRDTESMGSETVKTPLMPKSKFVMAMYASECQGMGNHWFCLPPLILPDRPSVSIPFPIVRESIVVHSERLQTMSLRPPLPPPKIG